MKTTIPELWDFICLKWLHEEFVSMKAQKQLEGIKTAIFDQIENKVKKHKKCETNTKEYQAKYYLRRTKRKRHKLPPLPMK